MGIISSTKNQFRTVIQWDDPQEWELFRKFDKRNDEIKNASKLILQPGQGCIFTYEGSIKGVFDEPGIYEIDTDNKPFLTTFRKFMNLFESDHKTGFWFFRNADIANIRWGTRMPITYNDPVYSFPVNLRCYGNFSIKISRPEEFFTRIVAGASNYYAYELQELLLSRISQPIGNYLANAKFSYAEIDSNLAKIAAQIGVQTESEFLEFGFDLLDFRIEGSSFDPETNQRIAGISDVQAEARAAQLAGVSYAELQKMMAMRDAARNEGGMGAGMITAFNLQPAAESVAPAGFSIKEKLKELKVLFEEGLLDEAEYKSKKEELLKQF